MIYSYDGIKTELKTKLSLLSEWQKTLYFSVYERIIDAVSFIIRKLVYIAEFLYGEANWTTATKRKSLVTLGKLIDYYPYRKIGAYGYVQVIADSTFESSYPYTYTGVNITIPKWARFTDANQEVNVYCTEATTYYTNQASTLDVPVKEGVPKEFLYTATGSASEIITLASDNIDNDEIEVFIVDGNNDVLFNTTIVDELYFENDLDNYNVEIYNSDDFEKVYIEFGDGISTKKLDLGTRVLVKYAETLGSDGNITSAEIINTILTPLFDANGTAATLYVSNDEEIADGSEIEDTESIRLNGPSLYGAGYRAGSTRDWTAIINAVPYVYKSKVWSVNDIGGSTLLSEQNTVYVTAVTTTGDALTSAQETDIEDTYLAEERSPTEPVEWQSLDKIYLLFDVNAKIQNQTQTTLTTLIKEAINTSYDVLNTDFQVNIYESNYISLINDITNVLYHDTTLYHMETEMGYLETDHEILVSKLDSETSVLEDQVYLVDDSVQIWIKRKINDTWLTPVQIAETIAGNITATSVGQSEQNIAGEVITNNGAGILHTLANLTIRPETIVIYDGAREIDYTERNNGDGTGTFVGDDVDPTGANSIDYTTGILNLTLDYTPSGVVTVDYTRFKSFTISGVVDTDVNTISYSIYELINDSVSGVIYGNIDPTAADSSGYILNIAYQTEDGNGNQVNSVRLPRLNQITDVDTDYIFCELNY